MACGLEGSLARSLARPLLARWIEATLFDGVGTGQGWRWDFAGFFSIPLGVGGVALDPRTLTGRPYE